MYFFDQSYSTDEGFELQLATEREVPEDMQKLGATYVSYMTYDSEELDGINRNALIWAAVDEDNKCGLSQSEALTKTMDYMAKWGLRMRQPLPKMRSTGNMDTMTQTVVRRCVGMKKRIFS